MQAGKALQNYVFNKYHSAADFSKMLYIYESWYSKKIRKSKYLYAFLIFSHYWKATISHLKEKEMNLDFIVLCCSIIVKGWFFLNAPENLSFLTCYDIIYQFFMKF